MSIYIKICTTAPRPGLQAFFPCFPECFFFLFFIFRPPFTMDSNFSMRFVLSHRVFRNAEAFDEVDEAGLLQVGVMKPQAYQSKDFWFWKYIKLTKARHFVWEKFIHILEISFFWVAWVIVTVCVFIFFPAPFFYFIWWFLKLKTPTKDFRSNATNITLGHDVTSCRSSGHVFSRGVFARRPSCLSPVFGKFGVGSSKSEMPKWSQMIVMLLDLHSLELTVRPWKLMVGILVSFWNGLFSGAMLVLGRVPHRFFRSIPKLVLHGNGYLRIPHWELRRRCSASWPSDGWMARSFRNPSRCRRFGLVHHKWSQSAQVFAGLQYNSLTNWSMDSGVWIRHLQPKAKLVLMLANFWRGELRTSIFNHFYLVLFCLKWMIFPQMFFEMSDFPTLLRDTTLDPAGHFEVRGPKKGGSTYIWMTHGFLSPLV